MSRRIVLITGGAGFLGQHLVRQFQEHAEDVEEIRVIDLIKYETKMTLKERIPVNSLVADISSMDKECVEFFRDVHTVFHCAALVSYEFPSDDNLLLKHNVKGTQNVIEQCFCNEVNVLIYTSSVEVCMKPYFNNGFFSVVINQTESRELPPIDEKQLIFGSYAASKLKAEEMVLSADNEKHYSGDGRLRTVALRPPFFYGEQDNGMIPMVMKFGREICSYRFWRLAGPGGKHQFAYAGNIAWAHLCAKKVLETSPDRIAGLPVFVTDDTNLFDGFRFCEILTEENENKSLLTHSKWYIPSIITFVLAILFELIYRLVFARINLNKQPFSPKAMIVYLGSVIFFSRLRATLHLDYAPQYTFKESLDYSKNYYLSLCKKEFKSNNKI